MKKHHATRRLLVLLVCAALGLGLGLPAFSQDEYDGVLNLEPFRPLSRPAASFDHEQHHEVMEDCSDCHHGKSEDGRQDREDYDPSESCDTCHRPAVEAEKGATPLTRAYHRQCIGCHKQESKGPTHCAGCHQKG